MTTYRLTDGSGLSTNWRNTARFLRECATITKESAMTFFLYLTHAQSKVLTKAGWHYFVQCCTKSILHIPASKWDKKTLGFRLKCTSTSSSRLKLSKHSNCIQVKLVYQNSLFDRCPGWIWINSSPNSPVQTVQGLHSILLQESKMTIVYL